MTRTTQKADSGTEQWVLEWSQKTNNLHVRPLAMALGMNSSRFVLDAPTPGDYVPLFIGTHDDVNKEADRIREVVIARDQLRTQNREVSHG